MSDAKIIISYPSDMETSQALAYVAQVINGGRRVSVSRGRKQFCFISTFKTGVEVIAKELKYDGAPDSFMIME